MAEAVEAFHKALTPLAPYTPLMAAVSITLTVLVSPAIRTSGGFFLLQCAAECQLWSLLLSRVWLLAAAMAAVW
jgi:hypothetical protein